MEIKATQTKGQKAVKRRKCSVIWDRNKGGDTYQSMKSTWNLHEMMNGYQPFWSVLHKDLFLYRHVTIILRTSYISGIFQPNDHTWDHVFEDWIFIDKAFNYWYYSFFLKIGKEWKLLSLRISKIWHSYHVSSSFPPQASLSFMLFPLLSKNG